MLPSSNTLHHNSLSQMAHQHSKGTTLIVNHLNKSMNMSLGQAIGQKTESGLSLRTWDYGQFWRWMIWSFLKVHVELLSAVVDVQTNYIWSSFPCLMLNKKMSLKKCEYKVRFRGRNKGHQIEKSSYKVFIEFL